MMQTDKKIPLVEMFGPTIQGEGMMIGKQTYFLRFGLCDYKCTMCDSMHAVDPNQVKQNAQWLTQKEIFWNYSAFTSAQTPSTNWVTFSGGNPCIHELGVLVDLLRESGQNIAVETQGTFCPEWLKGCNCITVSPKGPGMGEKFEMDKLDAFLDNMRAWDADYTLKVVIFDQRDLEFAGMLMERYEDTMCDDQFFLSLGNTLPPGIAPKDLTHYDLLDVMIDHYKFLFDEIKHHQLLRRWNFLPQLHTFIWANQQGK